MEVRIISRKLIKPWLPTPFHLQNMRISFMDQLIPPTTMPLIFYYSANGNCNYNRQTRLEKSLSEVLTLFYPLAGRYIKDNLMIRCNDEGVGYAEATVNGELSRILLGEFEVNELSCLVPDELEESDTSPLMAIQISIFSCGGLAIGLKFSHRIIDAFTFSMFMNGWARACKVGMNDVAMPNYESGVLFPARDLSGFQFPALSKTKSEVVTKMLVFDSRTISKLKIEAMSGCGLESKQKPPSTTEVLTALIWRAQINANRARHGGMMIKPRVVVLLVLMNLRGKTYKKIPENCCGNIYTRITKKFQEDQESKMGLKNFVDQVSGAIRKSMLEYAKPIKKGYEDEDEDENEDELFSKVMKPCIEMAEETKKAEGEVDVHLFSNVVNLPFYEVDFGWGKPSWVSMTQRPYKAVFFMDRKGGDGVEAWVTLDKDAMDFFEKDPNIVMSLEVERKMADGIPILQSKI